MTKCIAIALLSLRAAIRSRLVATLVAILLLAIVGLGVTLEGDGTLAGQMRVLLYYTLGLTALILGAATLWASCGDIAGDIKDRQIQLVAVKPVHRYQLWLGKWLGLIALNAILLALAGVTVYALIQWNLRPSRTSVDDRRLLREELLTGRRLILPHSESLDNEVRKRMDGFVKEEHVSQRVSRREIYSLIEKRILAERSAVRPSASRQWVFDVPARLHVMPRDEASPASVPDTGLCVQFRLYSATRDLSLVQGTWTVGPEENPSAITYAMQCAPEGVHRFFLPLSALQAGGKAVVRFTNASGAQATTVVFQPENSVELLIRESSFETNLVRALIVILCHLALVAAVGLTAGTIFSFPVATFLSLSVLLAGLTGHYFTTTSEFNLDPHERTGEPSLYSMVAGRVVEHLDVVMAPAVQLNPLGPLSDGILVSWEFTGRGIALLALLYPAVLFLIGVYALHRRELALPD